MSKIAPESQMYYIQLIHSIWPSTQAYAAEDVNEEAIAITDRVVKEVAEATKGIEIFMVLAKIVIEGYRNRNNPLALAKDLASSINDLLDAVKGNRRYRFIEMTAALKNRSMIEIALMNI